MKFLRLMRSCQANLLVQLIPELKDFVQSSVFQQYKQSDIFVRRQIYGQIVALVNGIGFKSTANSLDNLDGSLRTITAHWEDQDHSAKMSNHPRLDMIPQSPSSASVKEENNSVLSDPLGEYTIRTERQ
jgi:hypothetical protein